MPSDLQTRDQVRPSDQARERAADALRQHYEEGRLDEVELERRVELAYSAQTRAQLKGLFRDLPWNPRSRARAERFWTFQRNVLRAHTAAYFGVNGGLVGIWAATGGGDFWPAGSLAGWGAFLGGHWAIARAVRQSRDGNVRRLGPGRSPSAAPRRSLRRS